MQEKRTLIVEDNKEIRELLCLYLDILGLSYFAVSDGKEAVDTIETTPIDVLVTDFQMPRMNGMELLEWCRKNQYHFPVIFITASSQIIEFKQLVLGDCCASLIRKPIDLKIFEEALIASLNRLHHPNCMHSVVKA